MRRIGAGNGVCNNQMSVCASLGVWSGYSLAVHDYEMRRSLERWPFRFYRTMLFSRSCIEAHNTYAGVDSRYQNKVPSFSTSLPPSQASEILHLHIILLDLPVIYLQNFILTFQFCIVKSSRLLNIFFRVIILSRKFIFIYW